MPKREGRYKGLPRKFQAGTFDSGTEYLEIRFEVYAMKEGGQWVDIMEFTRGVRLFLTEGKALEITIETLQYLGLDYDEAMDLLLQGYQETGDMSVNAGDLTWAEWVWGDGVELKCEHDYADGRDEPYENWRIPQGYSREPDSVSESTLKRVSQRLNTSSRNQGKPSGKPRSPDTEEAPDVPDDEDYDISDDEIPF